MTHSHTHCLVLPNFSFYYRRDLEAGRRGTAASQWAAELGLPDLFVFNKATDLPANPSNPSGIHSTPLPPSTPQRHLHALHTATFMHSTILPPTSLCLCVSMYRTCVCVYVCVCACACVCTYICCIYVCMYVCIRMYVCMYRCMYILWYVCMDAPRRDAHVYVYPAMSLAMYIGRHVGMYVGIYVGMYERKRDAYVTHIHT